MKQKKIGDILYVYSTTAYEITEDTDATVIKIQEECIPAYAALNASLVSKFSPINYKLFCVRHPEWADYLNDYTVTIDTITGGTVTASPTSGDEGEEITLTQEASTGYEFVSWDVEDGEGDPITVTDNKFLMPASNVTVGATFDKIDFDITVDSTIQNGSLSAPATANLGDTVTITATPASGYKLDTLTVMCGSLEITVVDNQFTMPAGDVTITGTFVQDAVPYEEQYFTIESEADNNAITIKQNIAYVHSDSYKFYVSVDNGSTWEESVSGGTQTSITKTLNTGDKMLIKSNDTKFCQDDYYESIDDPIITSTHEFKVYGNILSLSYGDNFSTGTGLTNDMFKGIFYGSKVTDASNLILPNGTNTGIYDYMFYGCASLVNGPVLPALNVSDSNAYRGMFENCTSLNEVVMLVKEVGSSSDSPFVHMFKNAPGPGTLYVNPELSAAARATIAVDMELGSNWTMEDYIE